MPYVTEHFQITLKTLRWSPRSKAFYNLLTSKETALLLQTYNLTRYRSIKLLVKTSYWALFHTFFIKAFFTHGTTFYYNSQKKLTNTFIRTIEYQTLRTLNENKWWNSTGLLIPKSNYSLVYWTPLKLPYLFYTQLNYKALLHFFTEILVTNWNQFNLTQLWDTSRSTLDNKFHLLRFYNLYFFKVANL